MQSSLKQEQVILFGVEKMCMRACAYICVFVRLCLRNFFVFSVFGFLFRNKDELLVSLCKKQDVTLCPACLICKSGNCGT